MIPRIIISPPFGNYLSVRGTTSVAGSFTVEKRSGLVESVIRSLRRVEGGWVNQIGLRNKGIRNVVFKPNKIYSLAPLEDDDYNVFWDVVPADVPIEFNLGCPNVDGHALTDLRPFVERHPFVICKVPPQFPGMSLIGQTYDMGVRAFHLCNTLPSPGGGISGKQLQWYSLKLIKWTRENMPNNIHIIGGGGIYNPSDVDLYYHAGAHSISISTVWMTPWRAPSIISK